MKSVGTKRKKAGRPAKATKREIRACVRFTKTEYFIIREKATKAGVNASEYLRQIAIKGLVKTRLTEEERQIARQLIGMANNLNQVVKCFHKDGFLSGMSFFENYRNQLDAILNKLKP